MYIQTEDQYDNVKDKYISFKSIINNCLSHKNSMNCYININNQHIHLLGRHYNEYYYDFFFHRHAGEYTGFGKYKILLNNFLLLLLNEIDKNNLK